jgi:hypothetical protein
MGFGSEKFLFFQKILVENPEKLNFQKLIGPITIRHELKNFNFHHQNCDIHLLHDNPFLKLSNIFQVSNHDFQNHTK